MELFIPKSRSLAYGMPRKLRKTTSLKPLLTKLWQYQVLRLLQQYLATRLKTYGRFATMIDRLSQIMTAGWQVLVVMYEPFGSEGRLVEHYAREDVTTAVLGHLLVHRYISSHDESSGIDSSECEDELYKLIEALYLAPTKDVRYRKLFPTLYMSQQHDQLQRVRSFSDTDTCSSISVDDWDVRARQLLHPKAIVLEDDNGVVLQIDAQLLLEEAKEAARLADNKT